MNERREQVRASEDDDFVINQRIYLPDDYFNTL